MADAAAQYGSVPAAADNKQPDPAFKLPRIQPTDYRSGNVILEPEMTKGCCGGSAKTPAPVMPFIHLPDEKEQQFVKVKKAYVIMNPHGGNGRGPRAWRVVEPILVKAGIECTLLLTERPQHATEYARTKPLDGYDCLIAIGGDGTFFEVINGLMTRDDKKVIPLGLIPGGTGNSVMKTLDLDISNWQLAAEAIVNGAIIPVDVGKCTSEKSGVHYWFNEVGWGLGADANVTAENLRCCGPLRYDVGALWHVCLGKERHVRFVIDGEVLEGNFNIFLAMVNQHAGSNMKFCPWAAMNDGLLDVIIFQDKGRAAMLSAFGELKKVVHVYNESALYYRFKRMEVYTADHDLVNVDGDNVSTTGPSGTVIECLPAALNIFYRRNVYEKKVPAKSS